MRRVDPNTVSSRWSSAVAVTVDKSVFSGVVVAPRFVLTAAHVVGGIAPALVSVQVNIGRTPIDMKVKGYVTFPGASFPYDDLVLIELLDTVPPAVRILPVYRQAPPLGLIITVVGYGASGRGDAGVSVAPSAAVKRSGKNVLDVVRPSVDRSGRRSLFFGFDFDGPEGFGPTGGPSLGNGIEAGLAPGDSGSPVFADIEGRTWLVGISNHVGVRPGASDVDYKFGTPAGGMLLSDPRFIAWLVEQTRGTLQDPPSRTSSTPRRTGRTERDGR